MHSRDRPRSWGGQRSGRLGADGEDCPGWVLRNGFRHPHSRLCALCGSVFVQMLPARRYSWRPCHRGPLSCYPATTSSFSLTRLPITMRGSVGGTARRCGRAGRAGPRLWTAAARRRFGSATAKLPLWKRKAAALGWWPCARSSLEGGSGCSGNSKAVAARPRAGVRGKPRPPVILRPLLGRRIPVVQEDRERPRTTQVLRRDEHLAAQDDRRTPMRKAGAAAPAVPKR
jgi:hypothetical protein